MREYRYHFIAGLLLITLLTGAFITSGRRLAIRDMIDEAGRNREPIVAASFFSLPEGRADCVIASLDHEPVPLMIRGMPGWLRQLFFSDSGVLRFAKDYEGERCTTLWDIALPDIHVGPAVNVRSYRSIAGRGSGRFPCEMSSRFVHFSAKVYPNCVVLDLVTGDTASYVFDDAPNWFRNQYFDRMKQDGGHYVLSPDGTVLIVETCDHRGVQVLTRCDLAEKKWSNIIRIEGLRSYDVGPEGKIIALNLSRNGPNEMIFIDAHGHPLHTIWGMHSAVIGDRWIACRESGELGGIVVIDTEENWRERRLGLKLPDRRTDVAMYEPPHGGVREMLAMRASEGELRD